MFNIRKVNIPTIYKKSMCNLFVCLCFLYARLTFIDNDGKDLTVNRIDYLIYISSIIPDITSEMKRYLY